MTDHGPAHNTLDAYLDGTMPEAERVAFERRLQAEPALRAEHDLQRRIDSSLRKSFVPPAALPINTALTLPGASARPWFRNSQVWAAAAVIALALGAGYVLLGPTLFRGPGNTSADSVYTRLVKHDFEPQWVCENDEQFLKYTHDKFGTSFLISPSSGLSLVGWHYTSGVLGDEASVLMANADKPGAPAGAGGEKDHVIMLIDKSSNDRPVNLNPASGLHLFKKKVGSLVFYEVSPRDHAMMLDGIKMVK